MSHLRSMGLALVAAFVGVVACGPETKTVIDEREEPCGQWCERAFGPCGTGASEVFATEDECVEQCTTVGEAKSSFDTLWGYNPKTGKDECSAEMRANIECIYDLSEEDFCVLNSGTVNSLPREERPCFEQISIMSRCSNDRKEAAR